MALTIKDFDGVDIIANPLGLLGYRVVGKAAIASVTIQARVIEDNVFLTDLHTSGTLDWNDGSLPTVYESTAGTATVNATKNLTNGAYLITVSGRNYRAPVADAVLASFPVLVVQQTVAAAPQNLIFGPILPRDSGAPNASQWNFNTDSDLLILESSVKMLLLTVKGERLMEPDYGTNIKRILFDLNISGVESMIREEIVSALTRWEPRLALQSMTVQRMNDRSVVVFAVFQSRVSGSAFNVDLSFVK